MSEPAGHGLLDTNTVILLTQFDDPSMLPAEPLISTITLAELSVAPLVAATEVQRAARQSHAQQAEADLDALPFDMAVARAFGRVAASLRRGDERPARERMTQ